MQDASTGPYRSSTLRTHAEFHAAAELYACVFGYDSPDLQLNTNLLSALVRNGGSVVGVHTRTGALAGFAYGFSGRDASGREFHYSQAAVVHAEHQGAGVGRLLKRAQRDVALGWGHRRMRWTFDPLLTRNAHFNFSSLRAEGIDCIDDYYDRPGTDRVVVDWVLDRRTDPYDAARSIRPPAFGSSDWGRPTRHEDTDADAVWLPVPAQTSGSASSGAEIMELVRDGVRSLLAEDRTLVACRRVDATTAAYLAVRRLDEENA
ncbi:putative GNAT superfamily acetyltransferase [Microbacterium sp. W4I4]|uniref:GNAT family N-acetyltransferase n=1 Tax=Microbacterium sp. W4I4 TaxID=3042295 RepID=UPI00277E2DAC|nr:GNAT family N-acetyltransferase [Microbacterium sp. W4I4]MDQ0614132.1 putative GNAT superfamily acetyltransferase [Microbacterium sp. W4I4]